MATTRVNCTFDVDHLKRIENYASKMGINRSAAISVLTAQALDGQEGISALNRIADLFEAQTKEGAPIPSALPPD